MKRSILFAGFFIVASFAISKPSHGQGGNSTPGSQLAGLRTDIIPHSPEAEAMTKFTSLPVTLYSGMPEVSIPIYTIKGHSLQVPVSLAYNYNGYKPSEIASYAGLGWSVQGGGVITRIVKGKVDESSEVGTHYDDFANVNTLTSKQDVLADIATGNTDSEPDIYIFNANGLSGRFILVKGKAYTFPYQQIKIATTSLGFIITNENGDRFFFEESETTNHKNEQYAIYVPPHKSAWYLTKIISADQSDIINYSYSTYTYHQYPVYSETYTQGNYANGSSHMTAFIGDWITSKVLAQITYRDLNINFIPDNNYRTDLGVGTHALDYIYVSGNQANGSTFLKKFTLLHSYFKDGILDSKLNLKEVDIVCATDGGGGNQWSTTVEKYLMDYQDESLTDFKGPYTKGVDMWGYYNGVDGNTTLIPAGYFSSNNYSFANRDVDSLYSRRGILTKLTYPTGGYTTFDYAKNKSGSYDVTQNYINRNVTHVTYYDPNNLTNGGTEVATPFTLNANQTVDITYTTLDESNIPTTPILRIYNSSGGLVYTCPVLPNGIQSGTATQFLQAGNYAMVVRCEPGIFGNYGRINYKEYIVNNTLKDGPGLRIRKFYFYDNINNTSPTLEKDYYYNSGIELGGEGVSGSVIEHNPNGCGQGSNNCTVHTELSYTVAIRSALSDLIVNPFYYQNVTEVNKDATQTGRTDYQYNSYSSDVEGVYLTDQNDYKYDPGTLNYITVKSSSSTYEMVTKNNFSAFAVQISQMIDEGGNSFASPDITHAAVIEDKAYAINGIYNLNSAWRKLNQTHEITYDKNGANPVTQITDYHYDNPNHIYPTSVITTSSKGEQITSILKYPLDYNFGNCITLSQLNADYEAAKFTCMNTYVNTCMSSLIGALVQPYTSNPSTFTNTVNYYHCVPSYKTNSATLFANRDIAINNYFSCLSTAYTNSTVPWQKSVLWMLQNNIYSPVIEKHTIIHKSDGNDYVLQATRNEYSMLTNNNNIPAVQLTAIKQTELTTPLLYSSFTAIPDNYYKPQVNFNYDGNFNLSEQLKNNDITTCYLWNYNHTYPVAQVVNADNSSVASTSFEGDSPGNWSFTGATTADPHALTGKKDYSLAGSNNITRSGLSASTTYIVSYWSKSGAQNVNSVSATAGRSVNGWVYYEHEVINPPGGLITVSGSGTIDELRLYPKGAMMTTYAYNPVTGITSQCDPNNRISYYEYDAFNRLVLIRDQDNNILKKICYNYAGQPEDCSPPCDRTPNWQNTSTPPTCEQGSCGNTGYQLQEQIDINPCSPSYNTIHLLPIYNPTACPPSTNVIITYQNPLNLTGFTVVYTDVLTSQTFTYNIPAGNGSFGCIIPPATYFITISNPDNLTLYTFSCGCKVVDGISAGFGKTIVSSTSCNSITIDNIY